MPKFGCCCRRCGSDEDDDEMVVGLTAERFEGFFGGFERRLKGLGAVKEDEGLRR